MKEFTPPVSINVFRTHIELCNYQLGMCKELEFRFSVQDMITHRYLPKGRYYDELSSTLYLPRGIQIPMLENLFNKEALVQSDTDDFYGTGPINLKVPPRNDIQKKAIRFMLCMGEYERYVNHTMLSLNLNTGKGKTYCAVAAISYLQINAMIICSQSKWLEQWKEKILEYTDIDPNDVMIVAGSGMINRLIKKGPQGKKIFLITHDSLSTYASAYSWPDMGNLFKALGIGIKIYDECHLEFDAMFMIDCFTNTAFNYYLTATMGRSNDREDFIYGMYFKSVPKLELFDPESDPHTHYVGIKYNSCPDPVQMERCKNAYGLNRPKYTDYLLGQPNFEKLLHIITRTALYKPGKHLWYIGTINAIKWVKNWLYENYPELIGDVGMLIGETEDRLKETSKKIILTTTKSGGAAVDIYRLYQSVNLAEPFKSKILAQQTLGRTRADDTMYLDCVDLGFHYTKRFYDAKKPVFAKYAKDCRELVLRQPELDKRVQDILDERAKLDFPMEFWDS